MRIYIDKSTGVKFNGALIEGIKNLLNTDVTQVDDMEEADVVVTSQQAESLENKRTDQIYLLTNHLRIEQNKELPENFFCGNSKTSLIDFFRRVKKAQEDIKKVESCQKTVFNGIR